MPNRTVCHPFLAVAAILLPSIAATPLAAAPPIIAVPPAVASPTGASPTAASPSTATSPTAAPPSASATPSILLGQLADRDPAVRISAEQALMGLSRSDLPKLERAAQDAAPLRPGQGELLHEIVTQVFLSGEPTESDPSQGFMGVKMRSDDEGVHSEDDSDPDEPIGVVVAGRIPGFAAYRMLRDGDIILNIAELDANGTVQVDHRVRSFREILTLVSTWPAGQFIKITVLRNGRQVEVAFVLAGRPAALKNGEVGQFERFRDDRLQAAETYWQHHFARYLDESIS